MPLDYLQTKYRSEMDPEQMDKLDFTSAFQSQPGKVAGLSLGADSANAGIESMKSQAPSVIGSGVAAGAMGGPAVAGITVGGQLLSQYLGQKAADERARRDRGAAIEKGYGEDQQQAINSIMANNARALR